MTLSQKNYTQVLPGELIKQAKKSKVRECDENEKGHFLAYVDDKEDTFDVSILINKEGTITEHNCDCKSKVGFCRHKVALLLFLEIREKSNEKKIKSTKKASSFEILLEDADAQKLKDWVRSLLAKNKELELAFIHQFSKQQKNYTPAAIKQLTLNVIKAVAGNRKNLETGEVKKIIDLWTEIHESVITHYYANITDSDSFLIFNTLVETCNEVILKVNQSGNKLNKYIGDLLLRAIEPIHDLQNENAWDIASGFFAERINNNLRNYYIPFLMHLHDTSNNERKERLTHKLVKQYTHDKSAGQYKNDACIMSIFNMVKNSGLFEAYYRVFAPIRFNDEYNNDLIRLLIEYGYPNLAEEYCLDQIRGGYNQGDSAICYFLNLKEIYNIEKADKKLSAILTVLVPQTFDFTDFLKVYEQLEGDEKKKWRTKILTRAGHMGSYNYYARLFSFKLMDHEQNYKKMIEYMGSDTPYSIIVQYADKMAMVNKNDFIRKLFNMSDDRGYNRNEAEMQNELFQQLNNTLQKHYPLNELKMILQQFDKTNTYYRGNNFMIFVKEHLT